ncbi:MAG: RdgB/HAM1 family non-canonical purine NTP pyrophosphatase [bacterium]|nr:MAG: RdgB/HAM1 family non-canonical purine NTP pyrophosphatase [bacterium]
MRIVLATRNAGKIGEIRSILSGLDLELVEMNAFPDVPEPPEDGDTFYENALVKAKTVHEATGMAALADDSGLEVEALDGAPGVHSARYGGPGLSDLKRSMKLISAVSSIPEEKRDARFRCVMVYYPSPEGRDGALVTEGFLYGKIAFEPAGENGFGYDPIFLVPERGITVAQMPSGEKNRISHRYRALVEMKWMLIRRLNLKYREPESC